MTLVKNKDIVLRFAELLESASGNIEVFCSSEKGSIQVGSDSTEVILKELSDSKLFIPVISREYYDSHYCMIELGIACSYLFEKYKKNGGNYIYPFALYPVKRRQALSGTPIANIQVGDLNSEDDLRSFFESIAEYEDTHVGSV